MSRSRNLFKGRICAILVCLGAFSIPRTHAGITPKSDETASTDCETFVTAGDQMTLSDQIANTLGKHSCAAIMGGSSVAFDSPLYLLAEGFAHELGKKGWCVITGGGPGIMDAANRGARRAGALSIGFDLKGPWPAHSTNAIDRTFIFANLESRKRALFEFSHAWILFPGGIGSLGEFFSILDAVYSKQIPRKPLILVDSNFWRGILSHLRNTVIEEYGLGRESSIDFIRVINTLDEFRNTIAHWR